MFDKVNVSDHPRKPLQAAQTAFEIVAAWKNDEEKFRDRSKKYLLY